VVDATTAVAGGGDDGVGVVAQGHAAAPPGLIRPPSDARFAFRDDRPAWYDNADPGMSTTPGSAIILVRPDLLARARQHFEVDPSISVFDASEIVPPVNVVAARAQMLLVVERVFTEIPAGMEFLERFREANGTAEIRVLNNDSGGQPSVLQQAVSHPAHLALRGASQPLGRVTGRRALRVQMPSHAAAIVNGVSVKLVNVSPHGAQVVSPSILRPGERVSARLPGNPRLHGTVVWCAFELSAETHKPAYRAGLSFA